MKVVDQRNEQFEHIAALKATYQAAGNPIISMDTKKKEHLGNFYRAGYLYTTETITLSITLTITCSPCRVLVRAISSLTISRLLKMTP